LARKMPDVHIQNVRMLQADQIPSWLNLVPTCIELRNPKNIYKGGDALQYLSRRLDTLQEQFALRQQQMQQYAQPQPPMQQYASAQGSAPRQMPPPTGGMAAHPPNFPPPGARPMPMPGQGPMGGPPTQPQAPPAPQVQSSLQPASGTGQFGCSLDTAFQSTEAEVTQAPPDNRFSQSGTVSQSDMQKYMAQREQVIKRGAGGRQMPAALQ
jgi:hypothetical protein